jgi:hypothetical protein
VKGGEARGEARGELKGRRDALRALLRAKGLATGAEDDARIEACDDAATLDRWIIAAAGASALREVFGGDGA